MTVLADAFARVDGHDERIALDYLGRIVGARVERRPLEELINAAPGGSIAGGASRSRKRTSWPRARLRT